MFTIVRPALWLVAYAGTGRCHFMAVEIYSTDTDSGQISVIRKKAGGYQLGKEIPVGQAPRGGVKFTKDGRGVVSNTSTNTVSEIDAPTHREIARTVVGSGPPGL